MANRVENVNRMRELQRARSDYAQRLDEVLAKIAQADERRISDRENERKWNRVLDHLESSMDELKALIAACDGELLQLQKRTGIKIPKPAAPEKQRNTSAAGKTSPETILKRAAENNAGQLRGALEKGYGGRIGEVTMNEARALLDEYKTLTKRSDLSASEAKVLDAIRSVLPVLADRMQEWQIRWSRSRKA